ncbi:MAG TPA: hypothetical protein VFQ61_26215, partial [Polyangiaceae bacterium]|nr:hypothetical protein [Polyangiaceae bacterium]
GRVEEELEVPPSPLVGPAPDDVEPASVVPDPPFDEGFVGGRVVLGVFSELPPELVLSTFETARAAVRFALPAESDAP